MTVEAALAELEILLYGWNYAVFLDLIRVPVLQSRSPVEYIQAALGTKAEVGGVEKVSVDEMLDEVERSLTWVGDTGSHPDENALRSPRFQELVKLVRFYLLQNESDTAVWSFWLKSGHPHYPVWWDFAFVISRPTEVEVFIGSSSD